MEKSTLIKALVVILVLLASSPAFGVPMCGTEICVELFGFSPITGAVFTDSVFLPKGPIVTETAPFCLALGHIFPPSPPLQGAIGRHFWLAFLGPGGTGDLEVDLTFIGLLNGIPQFRKLPFPIAFFSFVGFQAGAVGLDNMCISQREINELPAITLLFAGGYTKPLSTPLGLGDLLGNAVSGVTFFTLTIGP